MESLLINSGRARHEFPHLFGSLIVQPSVLSAQKKESARCTISSFGTRNECSNGVTDTNERKLSVMTRFYPLPNHRVKARPYFAKSELPRDAATHQNKHGSQWLRSAEKAALQLL